MPVGVVGLSERHTARPGIHRPPGFAMPWWPTSPARLRAFEQHALASAEEVRRGGVQLLGTSGTVTTLAGEVPGAGTLPAHAGGRTGADPRNPRPGAVAGLARNGAGRGWRGTRASGVERADFVLPGCAIYTAIHTLWPVAEVTVADRGLREGMLLRLIRDAKSHTARN